MSKKAIIYLATPFLIACGGAENSDAKGEDKKETPQASAEYVTISGSISNPKSEELAILNREGFSKIITVNEDGTFSDTLKVSDDQTSYSFAHAGEYSAMFLKNGFDLKLTLNTNEFDETVKYEGVGSGENNYLVRKYLREEQDETLRKVFELPEEAFEEGLETEIQEMKDFLAGFEGLDQDLVESENTNFESLKEQFAYMYKMELEKKKMMATLENQPSPDFTDFPTPDGSTKSLADYNGKYTYIDVWATWCGPCKAEVPYIKEMKAKYEGKNLQIVSISVDEDKDLEKWKNMIESKGMDWDQLIAPNNWQNEFITAYGINSIPRFILLDPEGNVLSADALRPSNPDLYVMLDSLDI